MCIHTCVLFCLLNLNLLWRRILCCSVLQCVAECCSVLQCVAECCSVLQCVAVWRSVAQCGSWREQIFHATFESAVAVSAVFAKTWHSVLLLVLCACVCVCVCVCRCWNTDIMALPPLQRYTERHRETHMSVKRGVAGSDPSTRGRSPVILEAPFHSRTHEPFRRVGSKVRLY